MTTKSNAKTADPFATVRAALVESVDTVTENNGKVVEFAKAEMAKAKDAAAEQAEVAQATLQANMNAAVTAGEIVVAGAEKFGSLVQEEMTHLVDGRVAALKGVIGATTIKDAVDVQLALVKAEQASVKSFFEAFAKLGQAVTNDALKPVQTQVTENLKALNVKAA